MLPFPSPLLTVGAAPAGYGLHLYWRILILNNHGNASFSGLSEVEMRATAGGADQCSGGTASTSNNGGGGSAANCFDNNVTTVWLASGATNQWVKYQFASPVTVQEVAVTTASGINGIDRGAKDCKLQYSDDDSAWTDAFSFTWDSPVYSSTRTFPQAAFASGFARSWRMNITANGGDANFTYIDELEFRATSGGADQTAASAYPAGDANGRPIGSCSSPAGAFDNSTGNNGGSPKLHNIGFVFPNAVEVQEITIKNASTIGRSPVNFTFDWLDQDNVTWHTQKTVSSLVWTTAPQTLTVAVI